MDSRQANWLLCPSSCSESFTVFLFGWQDLLPLHVSISSSQFGFELIYRISWLTFFFLFFFKWIEVLRSNLAHWRLQLLQHAEATRVACYCWSPLWDKNENSLLDTSWIAAQPQRAHFQAVSLANACCISSGSRSYGSVSELAHSSLAMWPYTIDASDNCQCAVQILTISWDFLCNKKEGGK